MAVEFDARVLEEEIKNRVEACKATVKSMQNFLADALAFAAGITAADMMRLDLTDNQKSQLTAFVTSIQNVHDAIADEGPW